MFVLQQTKKPGREPRFHKVFSTELIGGSARPRPLDPPCAYAWTHLDPRDRLLRDDRGQVVGDLLKDSHETTRIVGVVVPATADIGNGRHRILIGSR